MLFDVPSIVIKSASVLSITCVFHVSSEFVEVGDILFEEELFNVVFLLDVDEEGWGGDAVEV